ncbi:MAG: histidine--tRNA ligase [Planctomycetota bacterium]|nr:histidine--tRNA ligase [Planctomycetota bacterium]
MNPSDPLEPESTSKRSLIQPRTLKGFRDYLPQTMIPRERLMSIARKVYRSYGFSPIDTPALEHLEILTGKGSDETDRQLYRFQDHGQRDVGMRFDLTVPLARFVAQHINTLGTPFKRYHIAPVWRGENTQRGRYREFMQCDFDTIGTRSVAADIETGLVINDLFEALGFERFTIHINNRQILTGLLEQIGIASQATAILRSLDKLGKIGSERTAAEMIENAEVTEAQAQQVLAITTLTGSNQEILDQLKPMVDENETGSSGTLRLQQILDGLTAGGMADDRIKLDVSIARGLDYYTGAIFETFLDDLPEIGSVCSGGRYDNLAELYTKQELPGIGASLGLDRLLAAMEELDMLEAIGTPAEILVVYFEEDQLHRYLEIARDLRQGGFAVEVYPEAKKLGKQLKYADGRGFRYALIAGGDELARNVCQIKDLQSGESVEYPLDRVVQQMQS